MSESPARDAAPIAIGWQLRPLALEEAPLAYPLLVALDGAAEPLPAWCDRVGRWLRPETAEPGRRGIVTLRNRHGVIHALFFYTLDPPPTPTIMVVGPLRAVEPTDAWHGLGATLRSAERIALEHGCRGILLRAEPRSSAWAHIHDAMTQLGHAFGYEPRGHDWYHPLEAHRTGVRPT